MLVLSFKNGGNNPTRYFFDKYYIPLVEIKDFNGLIDNKSFFDQPIKHKQKAYEKTVEILRLRNININDYTTRNLLVSQKLLPT